MSGTLEVVSVNISTEKGTTKRPVDEARLDETGITGDAHAGQWHRQISLLSQDSIEEFAQRVGRDFTPGEFAENITIRGMGFADCAPLDLFRLGDVQLETTQIGKECHGDKCAIFREVGVCIMPTEGIFCRVLHGGSVRAGDSVEYIPKVLKCRVITLSDRASMGLYADGSGPQVKELLEQFVSKTRWSADAQATMLPDDAAALRRELTDARDAGVDIVITTGGTGVGPRDITPDVVTDICDKTVPGIMEAARVKFGAKKPNALLSRGVAGVAGTTLIYTLPGSVKAVEEYMGEITLTMEHLLLMVHGLDAH